MIAIKWKEINYMNEFTSLDKSGKNLITFRIIKRKKYGQRKWESFKIDDKIYFQLLILHLEDLHV